MVFKTRQILKKNTTRWVFRKNFCDMSDFNFRKNYNAHILILNLFNMSAFEKDIAFEKSRLGSFYCGKDVFDIFRACLKSMMLFQNFSSRLFLNLKKLQPVRYYELRILKHDRF